MSALAPPVIISLPVSPVITFTPAPPVMVSIPAPPVIVKPSVWALRLILEPALFVKTVSMLAKLASEAKT